MHHLYMLLEEYPYLGLLQIGFTVWMIVDAYRRPADGIWIWVILLFQPFGAWIYFFVHKAGDFRGFGNLNLFAPRVSLDTLRFQAEKIPTLANHLALAQRLIERGEHDEALEHLRVALAQEPEHCTALYGMATCVLAQGHPEEAVGYLEKIFARDRRWSQYAAWRLLINAKVETGDDAGALALARDLARLDPTLEHTCILAERLAAEGQVEEAQASLQQALEIHRFAPGPARRRNRSWARQAARLQKSLQ